MQGVKLSQSFLTWQTRRFSLAGLKEAGSPTLAKIYLSRKILCAVARSEGAGSSLRDAVFTFT